MRILDLVPPGAVVDGLRSETKEGVLRELSEAVCALLPALSPDRLAAILLERETLGSTGIGEGVAIPHGKVPGLPGLVASFGRSSAGVDFRAIDGRPTHLFFTLFAPENSAGAHLKALARISRIFKNASFRDAILKAASADEVYRLIEAEDAKY